MKIFHCDRGRLQHNGAGLRTADRQLRAVRPHILQRIVALHRADGDLRPVEVHLASLETTITDYSHGLKLVLSDYRVDRFLFEKGIFVFPPNLFLYFLEKQFINILGYFL